jgi:hypothetical protein
MDLVKMPQRNCNRIKEKVSKVSKRIVLAIDLERYKEIVKEPEAFRGWIDENIARYPELFPSEITGGYDLHSTIASQKLSGMTLRRIRMKGTQKVFTIAPSGVMPYMTSYTDDVEKALFLLRFGVPYWALTYVFGKNDMFWFRQFCHFGRYQIVATTVKDMEKLPRDLLADEKHIYINGEKAYIATTVGSDCILGASISLSADEEGLTEAYGHFQEEVCHVDPNYEPESVNIDGWTATRKAWLSLFPLIAIIQCFLHAFLKIRNCCKKRFKEIYPEIAQRVWGVYKAVDATSFLSEIVSLQSWAEEKLQGTGSALQSIQKLCLKADQFVLAFEHPNAYRTSNMIDRHMLPMDRWLFHTQSFHGHLSSAEKAVRAWAIFHSFWEYSPRANIRKKFKSPAHKINGFVYHDNWLHNMLISTSIAGAKS